MLNTCIRKGASSFSSGTSSPSRSNSYSPSSYSNSLHYRDSTSNNLFVNIEAAVELHDLTSRSQHLTINENIKPEVSNIYHHQIQQIQRHHHLNHNTLTNHPHLPSQHLINHNLTNHLTNQHLINHNLANHLTNQHSQFANHQFDEIFSSAVAVAAVANLNNSQSTTNHSPNIVSTSNSSSNQANQATNPSSTNNDNSTNSGNNPTNNESNLMNVDSSANEQLENSNLNQQTTNSPTGSQIYTPQQNNMLPNFQYHQQNFTSSPNLPQQQHLHPSHLHANNQHAISQQQQNQQQQLANHHHNVQNHNLVNGNPLVNTHQTNQQQLQTQSLANSIQQQLQQQQCSLQQQMLQTLQHLPQDTNLMGPQLKELEAFAERFKQRRIKLGVTQADVGRNLGNLKLPGVGCLSQSTICRFESLTLSQNNMVALKPILCAWLEAAENVARKARAARDSIDASNLSAINCNGANGLGGLGAMGGLLCNSDKKRKRTSIAAPEKRLLEQYFQTQPRPSGEKIAAIADKLDLRKNVVRVWFCNQRQKLRRLKYSSANQGMDQT